MGEEDVKTKKGIRVSIDTILIIAFFLSFWLRFLTDINFFVTSIIWFFIGCIIAIYTYLDEYALREVWIKIIIVDSIAFFNAMINQNGKIMSIVVIFVAQSFGVLLYKNKKKLNVAEKMSIITILYLLYKIFTTEPTLISSWQYGIVISKLVGGNSASIILCTCLSIYVLYKINCNEKIRYWLFIVSAIIAYKADGSGGILASILFFVLILFLEGNSEKLSKKKMVIFFSIMLIVILLGNSYVNIICILMNDNSRFWMWGQYFKCVKESLGNFVFGASVESVEFLSEQKNIHNTYINWHYCFGLIPFCAFLVSIIKSSFMYLKKKRYPMLIISMVLALRAFTDEASFSFMTIWIYMWIDFVLDKKSTIMNVDSKES